MATGDEIYDHMAAMEGNKSTGYIPSAGSGVTIGIGIDLLNQTAAGLKAKGVPDSIIQKIEKLKFFGKNKAQIEAEGLHPESLTLDATELKQLNEPFIAEARSIAMEYGKNMNDKGRACLASLRHWAGRLGSSSPGKLAFRQSDGSVINYVWNAIKDKQSTNQQLLDALRDTLKSYVKSERPLNYRTIEREIEYLSK